MEWLNYHHLLYFWMVAREGSVTAAARQLHLAQPTLSNQLRRLEKSIGGRLFLRRGRGLILSETGQMVYRYADEIFSLGQELQKTVRGQASPGGVRLTVGVPDVLSKLVVYRLLQPALELPEALRLVTYEGKLEDLLADLAAHRLDVLLSESPLPPNARIRAFNHLLGESTLSCFATPELARKLRRRFPASLDRAPMLLATQNTAIRRALEQWFDEHNIRPVVRHEFEDSALAKVFGQAGEGVFTAPTAIEAEVCRQYRVKAIGRLMDVKERFYAISVERRLKHPAILAITRTARTELFRELAPPPRAKSTPRAGSTP